MDQKLERLAETYKASVRDEVCAKHKKDASEELCKSARSAYEQATRTSQQAHSELMTYLCEGIIEQA